MPGHGHPHRGGVLDRRRPLARRDARRRVDLHRAAGAAAELSEHPEHHLGRVHHGVRGDPPRLRAPLGKPHVRGSVPGLRHHVHRALAGGHPAHGRQGAGARHGQGGGRAGRAGQPGPARWGGRGAGAGRRNRLSRHGQGRFRRGRPRDAHRPRARIAGARLCHVPVRSARLLRLLRSLSREVRRGGAPRRGPGAGRPERVPRPHGRARLLDPAPPPEAARGVARPVHLRRPRARGCASPRSPSPMPSTTSPRARWSSSSTAPAASTSSR